MSITIFTVIPDRRELHQPPVYISRNTVAFINLWFHFLHLFLTTAWYSEFVVVRGQAELPCLVPDPRLETDRPVLVLWYKQDQSKVPIYR